MFLTAQDIRMPCGGLQTKYSKITVKIATLPCTLPHENVITFIESFLIKPSIEHLLPKLSFKIFSIILEIFDPMNLIGMVNRFEIIFLIYNDILPTVGEKLEDLFDIEFFVCLCIDIFLLLSIIFIILICILLFYILLFYILLFYILFFYIKYYVNKCYIYLHKLIIK